RQREFGDRPACRDAADLLGVNFRKPECAVRTGHDTAWAACGSGRRELNNVYGLGGKRGCVSQQENSEESTSPKHRGSFYHPRIAKVRERAQKGVSRQYS